MLAEAVEEAFGESLTGLYLDMTPATCAHISLARASRMATSNFKEAGKYRRTCVWRRERLKYFVSGNEDHLGDLRGPL